MELSNGIRPSRRKLLTVDKEKDGQQPAGEVNAIVQRPWDIEAGDTREARVHEFLARLLVTERPVLQEIRVHFSCDLPLARVTLGRPAWVWISRNAIDVLRRNSCWFRWRHLQRSLLLDQEE